MKYPQVPSSPRVQDAPSRRQWLWNSSEVLGSLQVRTKSPPPNKASICDQRLFKFIAYLEKSFENWLFWCSMTRWCPDLRRADAEPLACNLPPAISVTPACGHRSLGALAVWPSVTSDMPGNETTSYYLDTVRVTARIRCRDCLWAKYFV